MNSTIFSASLIASDRNLFSDESGIVASISFFTSSCDNKPFLIKARVVAIETIKFVVKSFSVSALICLSPLGCLVTSRLGENGGGVTVLPVVMAAAVSFQRGGAHDRYRDHVD